MAKEPAKIEAPSIGFYRRKISGEVVTAFVLEASEDKKGQILLIQWIGKSIPGRMALEKDVRVGVDKGCFNLSLSALNAQIENERPKAERSNAGA